MLPNNETQPTFINKEINEPEYQGMSSVEVEVLKAKAIQLGIATVDEKGNLIPVKE